MKVYETSKNQRQHYAWSDCICSVSWISPASSSGNNQKLVLLCCYFAFAMSHAAGSPRVGAKKELAKGVGNIFFTQNTFLSSTDVFNRKSSGFTHAADVSCLQKIKSSQGKDFLSNIVWTFQDTNKGSWMQLQLFKWPFISFKLYNQLSQTQLKISCM